ncbi:MAG: DUF4236 domain-containing protein [Spirochaetia bacterium]
MSIRFFRRIKIAPGVSLNFSKSGASVSVGPRGAKVTAGRRGLRRTVGLPGSGLYYTENSRWEGGRKGGSPSRERGSGREPEPSPERADMGGVEKKLDLGFFQRLFTPEDEKTLVEGLKEFVRGDEEASLKLLEEASHIVDARFMAGFVALKLGNFSKAAEHLRQAAEKGDGIGTYFDKYGLSISFYLPVTEHVRAAIEPSVRGALLALIECEQELGEISRAASDARRLLSMDKDDPAALLSLVELLIEAGGESGLKEVVKLTSSVENESEVHAALLYYKGTALHKLGMPTAARDAFTRGLRRSKNRSEELLRALRYKRALVYRELGKASRAKAEMEKLYAEDPDYEDVAAFLRG